MSKASLINLSLWDCGGRKIRYLYLGNETSFSVTKTGLDEVRCNVNKVGLAKRNEHSGEVIEMN